MLLSNTIMNFFFYLDTTYNINSNTTSACDAVALSSSVSSDDDSISGLGTLGYATLSTLGDLAGIDFTAFDGRFSFLQMNFKFHFIYIELQLLYIQYMPHFIFGY